VRGREKKDLRLFSLVLVQQLGITPKSLGYLCDSPRRLGKIEMSDTLGAGLHTP
jgi:hypothetical protein